MTGDMELRRAVLSLCLLCILAGATAKPQCVVFTPGLLKSTESVKCCLLAKGHTQPMDVDVSVAVGEKNISIFKEQIPLGETFKCSEFQVPEQQKASPVILYVEATSGDFIYTNNQPLVTIPPGNNVLIRSDKHMYKAGQTAHFFLIAVDNNLMPKEAKFPLIYMTDPNGNRLQEWRDKSTNGEFLLIDFTFLDEPTFGSYRMTCERESGSTVTHTIVVDNYDSPKFSPIITAPKTITILDEAVDFEVFSQYTYQQPVPGRVSGRLCRPPSYYYPGDPCKRSPDGICVPFSGEIDAQGKYKGRVELLGLQMERSGLSMNLKLEATTIEKGTNVQMTETKSISITNTMGRVSFVAKYMLPYYKPDLPYLVVIMVEDGQGQPESNKTVQLQMNGVTVQNLTSDENGQARYEIDTSSIDTADFSLQVIYTNVQQCYDSNWVVPTYVNGYHTVNRFFTSTKTSLQLQRPLEDMECGSTYNIKVFYVFGNEALEEGQTTAKIHHMTLARAKIVDSGEHQVDLSTSYKGEFNLTYTASADDAPNIEIIVFTVLKDEMVADTTQLSLEKCFKNQVSLNFSAEMGTPGSNVDLEVKATPNSMCMTRVFDSSLLLMEQGRTLTPNVVYSSLQYTRLYGYSYEGLYVAPRVPPCIDPNQQIMVNGTYYQPVSRPEEGDTSKLFSDIGVIAITETRYRQPQVCYSPVRFFERPMAMASLAVDSPAMFETTTVADGASGPAEIVSVRKTFPEMWIYQIMTTDEFGIALQSYEVPGTITTWKGDVTCLSNKTGFGMSTKPSDFISFQKIFVDLSYASSTVRGEKLRVVATGANYMDKSVKVKFTLMPSPDYTVEEDDGPVKCIPPQQRDSHSWIINPTSLGLTNITVTAQTIHIGDSCEGLADSNEPNRTDTIIQPLNVEAEGVKQEMTQSNFICGNDENPTAVFDINPSGNIVPGSLKAEMQVTGDILGPALANPQALYTQPTGCGEQTLATLTPIPIITEFLNKTGDLTDEMLEKAKLNMQIGTMKMMTYRNSEGSFSAFSYWNSEGSSWLTLQTLITFLSCSRYIPVDDRLLQQGIIYLSNLQDPKTGVFTPKGMTFNTQLKGAADDVLGFTCMVVRFFMESSYASIPTIRQSTLAYLEAASQMDQSAYNTIILWDTFNVVGNKERADAMAQKAKAMAIDDGKTIHWEPASKPKPQTPNLFAAPETSASIEMTAIALRALLHGKNQSRDTLIYATKVAIYLAQQQRQKGCYTSTKDTVETLKSLAIYAALTHEKNATNTVYLKKGDTVIREFSLNPSNRRIPQTEPLTSLPGEYRVEVQGNGCVLVQAGVQVNVPFKQEDRAFLLSVTTSPDDCKDGVAFTFVVQINASYEGIQNSSNMALMTIPLPSGYTVEFDSLKQLKSTFPKVDVKNNICNIYFETVDRKGYSFSMKLERRALVNNYQDKIVMFYDYYQADENAIAQLKHPCTLKSEEKV